MLSIDLLKANEPLANLTDEQLRIITALSKRDEEQVMAKRIGELHSMYDVDIKEATGIDKGQGEKTYDYLKRAMKEKASSFNADEYTKKIEALEKEKEELLKKGDSKAVEELRKQLDEKAKKIEAIKDQHREALAQKEEELKSFNSKLEEYKVESKFSDALRGLKFNDTIPEPARKALINEAQGYVKGLQREWINEGDKSTLIFKNAEGEILRDKATLEPLGIDKLIGSRLAPILAEERKAAGAGSKGGGKVEVSGVDLTGVSSKVELTKAIQRHLIEKGIDRASTDFAKQQTELYKELAPAIE